MQQNAYSINVKKRQSVVLILVLVNVAIFLLQALIPKVFGSLVLTSGSALTAPWTIFTSMFMHASFSHILFNMYALWMFGTLIEQRIGSKRFLLAYFVSGIVAALSFDIYNQIIGAVGASAVGASGAIMGILGLTIMLLPDLKVLFFFVVPMSMRMAGIIFALIDLFGLFNPSSSIAHIAHLGGLVVGLIFGFYYLRKKIGYQKKFTKINITLPKAKPRPNPAQNNYDQTIELSKDDIDNYFKYGKL